MTKELAKVLRGVFCFFTPFAMSALLNVLYADTLAYNLLALYLITFLIIAWVLLRPGYRILAATLWWAALFFLLASLVMDIPTLSPASLAERYTYSAWYSILCVLSAASGALLFIGGLVRYVRRRRRYAGSGSRKKKRFSSVFPSAGPFERTRVLVQHGGVRRRYRLYGGGRKNGTQLCSGTAYMEGTAGQRSGAMNRFDGPDLPIAGSISAALLPRASRR